jgi:MFS family permease
VQAVHHRGRGVARQVGGVAGARQPHDGQPPAGPQQVAHAAQRQARVHVVQRRHRGDQVERGRLEQVAEEIADQEVDTGGILPPGEADARLVQVDGHDVRDRPAQVAGQASLAAADVEGPPAPVGHGVEDHAVVVEVVVPPFGLRRHDPILAYPVAPACVRSRRKHGIGVVRAGTSRYGRSVPAPDPAATVPLRRNRDFLLLWSGQVVSTIGTRITSLAYPLLVLALTRSPARAGIVGFAQTLPFLLLYLPAGALVDRWNRKWVMLVSDGGRALALGSIAIALTLHRLTLVQIALVAFVEGCLFVFFQLAETAALPNVVAKQQLATAVAQNQARDQGADLAGQPLGGLLFGVSQLLPFAFDAVTYLVSFATMTFVRVPLQGARERVRTRLRLEISEGVAWIWRQRFLRSIALLVGATNFVHNALPLLVIVRAKELGAPPALIGAMFAFFGAGALLGALAGPWVQRHLHARTVVIGWLWVWAAEAAALVAMPNPVSLGALLGLGSVFGVSFNVVVATYRYALVPDRLQGRTTSVVRLIAWGTIPPAQLLSGVLAERIGAAPSFLVFAGVMLLTAIVASIAPSVRRAPPIESLAPEAA